MTIGETLLPEYDHEIATTRLFLERVPAKDAAWRPHPKSYALGDLAVHIAALPWWLEVTLTTAELDVAATPAPPVFTTVGALLASFDRNAAAGRAALGRAALLRLEPPNPPPRPARRLPAAARRAAALQLRPDGRHRGLSGRRRDGGAMSI